jgi:hypothetical protein
MEDVRGKCLEHMMLAVERKVCGTWAHAFSTAISS